MTADGWYAEDLDHLPDLPRRTELIDGKLVLGTPQRTRHSRLVTALARTLTSQAPARFEVDRQVTIRLDSRNRPEPDVLVTTAAYEPDRTYFTPDEVVLVVEVVSPESAHRDRTIKLRKYAEAGIAHYWRVEDEDGSPAVHTCVLDGPTRSYVATGIHRHELQITEPFTIRLKLSS